MIIFYSTKINKILNSLGTKARLINYSYKIGSISNKNVYLRLVGLAHMHPTTLNLKNTTE